MQQHYITRCPQCDTRFEVSLEQLNKAQGLVRCGACMKVFSADQHIETEPPATAEKSAPTQPANKAKARPASPSIPEVPLQIRLLQDQPATSRHRFTWSLLTLLALLALLAQILWFERSQLSQQPALAAVYEQACSYIDCRLNDRQDLPQIVSQQLIVRNNPKYLNALSVDLLMVNQAPFAQPFPAIRLVFSDLNGEPQAARNFQPQEYLGGDFSQQQLMPSRKPVQVNLQILDPGVRAPNYDLSFVPAKPQG